MRTLFNTTRWFGFFVAMWCTSAQAQAPAPAPAPAQTPDPTAAASTARDVAAEAATMQQTEGAAANATAPASSVTPAVFDQNGNLILPPEQPSPVPAPSSSAAPAAEPVPPPPVDSRIKQLVYNEGDVYTITTKYGYQTNIVISPQEEIQTISVGDKSVWQIIPSGNRIFIRPMEEDSITNMTLLTNRHSYQFDIKSLGPAVNEGNIYVAQFIYPEDIAAAAAAAAAQSAAGAIQYDALGNPLPAAAAAPMPATPYDAYGNAAAPAPFVAAASAPVNFAPAPVSAPVLAPAPAPAYYSAPVAAAAPLPANFPFGGPTPPPSAVVAEARPVVAEAHGSALARLNSEPSRPTQYIEVPSGGSVAAPPAAMPFGAPTPPPAPPMQAPAPRMNVMPVLPANANFNYTYTGADALAPLQVFDDGRMTWLKYASFNSGLPDVYVLDAAGNVTAVAHEARGDFMVVDAIAPEMIIKNANGSVHVYNETLAPQQ